MPKKLGKGAKSWGRGGKVGNAKKFGDAKKLGKVRGECQKVWERQPKEKSGIAT